MPEEDYHEGDGFPVWENEKLREQELRERTLRKLVDVFRIVHDALPIMEATVAARCELFRQIGSLSDYVSELHDIEVQAMANVTGQLNKSMVEGALLSHSCNRRTRIAISLRENIPPGDLWPSSDTKSPLNDLGMMNVLYLPDHIESYGDLTTREMLDVLEETFGREILSDFLQRYDHVRRNIVCGISGANDSKAYESALLKWRQSEDGQQNTS